MKIIHEEIAKVAKAIACDAYELMAYENEFLKLNPRMSSYVNKNWRHYIPFARQSLAGVLAKDYTFEIRNGQYSPESVEAMKARIYEALIIDGQSKAPPLPPRPEILRLRERYARMN